MSDTLKFEAATESIEVSSTGGRYNGGYIKNFSIIKVGEALGHGFWVDEAFVETVGDLLEAAPSGGVRSRYTHPDSKESLSRGLGRVFLMSRSTTELRGELHFWPAARVTPHGDLASHVIQLAKDDPEALGSSISFKPDMQATQFAEIDNPLGLPHIRIASLRFVDLVDSPATNPNGLFSQNADSVHSELAYAFGFTDTKPETKALGVELDMLLDSVSSLLHTKGYEIVKLNIPASNDKPVEQFADAPVVDQEPIADPAVAQEPVADSSAEPAPAEPVAEPAPEPQGHFPAPPDPGRGPDGGHFSESDLERYITSFGKEDGVDYFLEKIDFSEAQNRYIKRLNETIQELKNQLELSQSTEDVPFSARSGDIPESRGKGFAGRIKI